MPAKCEPLVALAAPPEAAPLEAAQVLLRRPRPLFFQQRQRAADIPRLPRLLCEVHLRGIELLAPLLGQPRGPTLRPNRGERQVCDYGNDHHRCGRGSDDTAAEGNVQRVERREVGRQPRGE